MNKIMQLIFPESWLINDKKARKRIRELNKKIKYKDEVLKEQREDKRFYQAQLTRIQRYFFTHEYEKEN